MTDSRKELKSAILSIPLALLLVGCGSSSKAPILTGIAVAPALAVDQPNAEAETHALAAAGMIMERGGRAIVSPGTFKFKAMGAFYTRADVERLRALGPVEGNRELMRAALAGHPYQRYAEITNRVRWSSSNTSVATIDKTSVAHCVRPGETTITATLSDVVGSFHLTVIPVPSSQAR